MTEKPICLNFQIHHPFQLRTYRFFDIGATHDYYNEYTNKQNIRQLARRSYLPANKILLDHIKQYGSKFKVSFSISGTTLEQFEAYAPELIVSFQQLAASGQVDFFGETYSHSLAAFHNAESFRQQIQLHHQKIKSLFGLEPKVFRNAEMIYSDAIGEMVYQNGYRLLLTEGAKQILGWKSPNYMYCNARNPKLKLLLRNATLSDDLALRFGQQSWTEWPLTAEKFTHWLRQFTPEHEVINLFINYATFGARQKKETGIFEFLKALPDAVFNNNDLRFATPSELTDQLQPISALQVPNPISCADEERDVTAWLGNELQQEAFDKLYQMQKNLIDITDPTLIRDWNALQSSDHFHFMSTKWFSHEAENLKNNPYNSPYDAFINFMNVISDMEIRLQAAIDKAMNEPLQPPELQHKATDSPTTTPTAKDKKRLGLFNKFVHHWHFNSLKKVFETLLPARWQQQYEQY